MKCPLCEQQEAAKIVGFAKTNKTANGYKKKPMQTLRQVNVCRDCYRHILQSEYYDCEMTRKVFKNRLGHVVQL